MPSLTKGIEIYLQSSGLKTTTSGNLSSNVKWRDVKSDKVCTRWRLERIVGLNKQSSTCVKPKVNYFNPNHNLLLNLTGLGHRCPLPLIPAPSQHHELELEHRKVVRVPNNDVIVRYGPTLKHNQAVLVPKHNQAAAVRWTTGVFYTGVLQRSCCCGKSDKCFGSHDVGIVLTSTCIYAMLS